MREIRKFGFSLGLVMNIMGAIMFFRGRAHFIWFTGIGSLSLMFAIAQPRILAPFKKVLDFIILLIGRIINAISLLVVFYLIFAPCGILLRLLGKDLLHQKIDKKRDFYWIKRKEDIVSKKSYERMG